MICLAYVFKTCVLSVELHLFFVASLRLAFSVQKHKQISLWGLQKESIKDEIV